VRGRVTGLEGTQERETVQPRLEHELAEANERIRELTERIRELSERERLMVAAQEIARVGSWVWNAATDTATWSPEMYRIFDRDPRQEPLSGEQFFARVHPDDRQRVIQRQLASFDGGPAFASDYRIVTDAGTERVLHARGRMEAEGVYVGTVQDVTEVRASERPLESSERAALEQFQAAFDGAPIGMGVANAAGRIVRVNDAFSWVTGYSAEELCSMTAMTLVHPDDLDQVQRDCAPLQSGEDAVTYAHRVEHAAGHTIWVQVSLTVLRDESGVPLYSVVQMVDVSEQRAYEDELQHMADHDALTGLLNRRGFEAALGAHVARSQRYGPGGALLMLDLDGFKGVNDRLGHAAGDELLRSTAGALTTRLRQSDIVARLGGDEFAVLLPIQNREEAEAVAQALLDTIRTRVTPGPEGQAGLVSASIGISLLAGAEQTAETLVADADLAMYTSKAAGKGCYTVYSPSLRLGHAASPA
jgi:diguanylate cyclase (GGDEF)-like protein/PAS domain S-box-containing protein